MVCLGHFCELHGPSSIMCTQLSDSKSANKLTLQNSNKLQTCASCKLTLPKGALNLITNTSRNIFVTTQYPAFQERYMALTKLVMKLLSVETTSDLHKPLFVGDNLNGYGLTKIFKIKDMQARGGERKYSLMIVCDEEIKILKNWNIIVSYLTKLIDSIQSKVQNVIDKKNLANTSLNNETYLRRSIARPTSLVELTGDDKLFVKLHLGAIQLIKDIQ